DGLSSLRFDGWYAYASWLLTGESRNYDPGDGTFGRITPRHSVGQGGPGAFELGLRFSRLDLTDDDVIGGVEDNLTLGLNWYATPNVRFMANYIKVLQLDRPGSEFDGDTPSVFQIRGQADF
ncbi:MAG: porin, partial [Arenicellales bacterium]